MNDIYLILMTYLYICVCHMFLAGWSNSCQQRTWTIFFWNQSAWSLACMYYMFVGRSPNWASKSTIEPRGLFLFVWALSAISLFWHRAHNAFRILLEHTVLLDMSTYSASHHTIPFFANPLCFVYSTQCFSIFQFFSSMYTGASIKTCQVDNQVQGQTPGTISKFFF